MNAQSVTERSITSNIQAIYGLHIGSIHAARWIYMSCTLERYPQQTAIPDASWSQICTEMKNITSSKEQFYNPNQTKYGGIRLQDGL